MSLKKKLWDGITLVAATAFIYTAYGYAQDARAAMTAKRQQDQYTTTQMTPMSNNQMPNAQEQTNEYPFLGITWGPNGGEPGLERNDGESGLEGIVSLEVRELREMRQPGILPFQLSPVQSASAAIFYFLASLYLFSNYAVGLLRAKKLKS
ncbi:hypothetical protein HYV83_00095 [Candidatus Woesearchaeota archaeon]|nr:hypothetical protein [Candidatus Woesearchaeota archaeon]